MEMYSLDMFRTVYLLFSSYVLFDIANGQEEWDVRLADGKMACEGRVEVFRQGTWGTIVHHDGWDTNHAGVICRQLGCSSAASITLPSEFGAGDGPVWHVICTGEENSIDTCENHRTTPIDNSYSTLDVDFWDHEKDAGVRCRDFEVPSPNKNYTSSNPTGFTRKDFHTLLVTDIIVFVVLLLVVILFVGLGVIAYRRFIRKLPQMTSRQSQDQPLPREPLKTKSNEDEQIDTLYTREFMYSAPCTSFESKDKPEEATVIELNRRGEQPQMEESLYLTCP